MVVFLFCTSILFAALAAIFFFLYLSKVEESDRLCRSLEEKKMELAFANSEKDITERQRKLSLEDVQVLLEKGVPELRAWSRNFELHSNMGFGFPPTEIKVGENFLKLPGIYWVVKFHTMVWDDCYWEEIPSYQEKMFMKLQEAEDFCLLEKNSKPPSLEVYY